MSTCHKRHQKSHFIWNFTGKLPRNADTHFARACAVEMHVHMSQESSEEPRYQLYTEIHRKTAAAQIANTLCASLRSRNACQHFTRATLCGNLQVKCRRPKCAQNADTHFVRASATEKHVRMSQSHQKSHFLQKFTGKLLRPRLGPERGHTLCNRNACPHITRDVRRATLYGNLEENCRDPDWAQNADTHFVRACAIETDVNTSQEPLYTAIYR